MATIPDPQALLGALQPARAGAPPPAGVPALWALALPVLRAVGEAGDLLDLGYEVGTGLEDRRRARDTFTLRVRCTQGLALLRTRLASVRWTLERSGVDYLSAHAGEASLTAELIPDPDVFRVEVQVPRAPLSPPQLEALAAALPAFEPLGPLLAQGQLISLGARRQASGALVARADLRLANGRASAALEAALATGLRPDARDPSHLRGASPAGPLHVWLIGRSAYLHLGPQPPIAGAWPDDPDEG